MKANTPAIDATTKRSIPREIRVYLESRDMSVRSIALALGISPPYLTHVLQGRTPGFKARERLINELDFPREVFEFKGLTSDKDGKNHKAA
jgi:transcriptional regulator with XRE-family HTH domain